MQQKGMVVELAAQGWQNKGIAVEVDLDRRQRYLEGGGRTACWLTERWQIIDDCAVGASPHVEHV